MTADARPWIPPGWAHPTRVDLPTGHHLRPIRASDVDLDLPAVMGSQERLWSIYGLARGWPPATMTAGQHGADLARRERENVEHTSFTYAVFDIGETELLGNVYIDPPLRTGADAEVTWWVVDWMVDTAMATSLDHLVPRWIATDWPFRQPRFIGRDLTWQAWLDLPRLPPLAAPTSHGARTTLPPRTVRRAS